MKGLVDMRAVTGVVEDTLWYRKGMPSTTRRKGSSSESFEMTCAL